MASEDLSARVGSLGQKNLTGRQIAAPPGAGLLRPFLVFSVEQGKKGDLIMYNYAYGNGRDGCDLKFLDRSFWARHGASQPGSE